MRLVPLRALCRLRDLNELFAFDEYENMIEINSGYLNKEMIKEIHENKIDILIVNNDMFTSFKCDEYFSLIGQKVHDILESFLSICNEKQRIIKNVIIGLYSKKGGVAGADTKNSIYEIL